ncbi:MAG: RIP metalloprotease RseP [Firmicutes bacterium]|nr:RIP metalloprotease RseP [Bacillota bacterium]
MPTIVAFILVFGNIVFFHELGHFLVAKLSGVLVYEFALGFGPRLIHRKFGPSVYSLRLLPLGGFVKLAGMDESDDEGDTIDEQHPGNFNNKPLLVRMAIIASGPLMNFVLAALILALYAALIVIPPTIVSLQPGYPAEQAGLRLEDQVIKVNDVKVRDLDHLIEEIESSPGRSLALTIKRGGEIIDLSVVPMSEGDKGIIGVGLHAKERSPLLHAVGDGFTQVLLLTKETIAAILGMFTGAVEPEIAGPIGIYRMVGVWAAHGVASLMFLAAVLSVNLGLINLLPIPVLDGGWLAIFLVEAVRGRPLKDEHRGFAQFVGLALLIVLMIFATYSDLSKLFS